MDSFGVATGQYGNDYVGVTVTGENASIGTSFEDVSTLGGSLTYFSGATATEILSDDINDTAAGTGARTAEIFSLDADYNFQRETATLNGITAVQLTNLSIRIIRVNVLTAGSTGGAVGEIVVRGTGGGDDQIAVPDNTDESNTSLTTLFTIPNEYWGVVFNIFTGCKKVDDAEMHFQARKQGEVFRVKQHIVIYQNYKLHKYDIPRLFLPKTDLRIVAKSAGGGVHLMGGYQIMLVHESKISKFPNFED